MSFRNAALDLASTGLPVFPLRPRQKRPRFAGSFHNATTDPAHIAAHWDLYPNDNIGIRPPEGIVVVDVDPRDGGELHLSALEGEHGQLPETWTARTGSGGWHYWFAVAAVDLRGKLCAGVDLKHGGTGYVVAPPSLHPAGGVYEWTTPPVGFPTLAPEWLRHRMKRAPAPPPTSRTPTGDGNGPYSSACLASRIAKASAGCRNRTLYGAARDAHRQGDLDTYEADLRAAATLVGLDRREIDATLRSARGGVA
jgi:hypothetical protein